MKIKDLTKWENELNVCIRCGYCYENCHLYNITGWESDSPRSKLLFVYGLISGEIKPSEDVAQKLFECFYCKQCEENCSANVSVTEIITDVRKALVEEGFEIEGTTVAIDEDLCCGCGICVTVCKTEATTIEKKEDDKRVASVDISECQGCGVCIASCPSSARTMREGYQITEDELLEKVREYLEVYNE